MCTEKEIRESVRECYNSGEEDSRDKSTHALSQLDALLHPAQERRFRMKPYGFCGRAKTIKYH